MKKVIIILIPTIIILAAIFLPIYNGRVGGCGVVEGGGCWNYKLNLIEYIKYKNEQPEKLLKECPDEMIANMMPRTKIAGNPASYYIKDGTRREIYTYDVVWVNSNCNVLEQKVY